jgi:Protein of unknown function (DUF992)
MKYNGLFTAALIVSALPAAAGVLNKVKPIGTLVCASQPAAKKAGAQIVLSCSLQGASRAGLHYAGTLIRKGIADAPLGKRVFTWTVFVQEKQLSPRHLTGRYVGITGPGLPGTLMRTGSAPVFLKPPPKTNQLGPEPGFIVLELNIKPVKA